jgi:hypothetical protein
MLIQDGVPCAMHQCFCGVFLNLAPTFPSLSSGSKQYFLHANLKLTQQV